MARTQHLGLNKFGAEGRISDEGYKFSLRDRDLIDSILQTLMTHDHQSTAIGGGAIPGPLPTSYLELEVLDTGGILLAGRDYYYKFSYLDANGNETEAGPAVLASTPDLLLTPGPQVLATATTGGSLAPGTYKYALAYYQNAGGVTTAPNLSTVIVPTGTATNVVTIPLPPLPDGADGWKIYRKSPGDIEYWLLDTVASGPTEYEDDGSISPDCTQKRPLSNTTNSTNSIVVDLPASELPLDTRIVSWRIYRTTSAGSYSANSLVATVVETTTEGGADLVTTYTDIGGALNLGIPLEQTAVPQPPPQLDAGAIFSLLGDPLPPELAPLGGRTFNLLLPGVLAAQNYHQFVPPHDMVVERIDGFYLTAPTGLSGANFLRLRFADDHTADEVQALWNNSHTDDETQILYNNAPSGTFTLSDGTTTTSAIAYNASSATIKTRLETDITSIITVNVVGSGTQIDPWVITYINPGASNQPQLVAADTFPSGASVVTTTIQGSNGGTFTLSDGVQTTSALAWNASAATIASELEADLTSIVDVSVTGVGTEADPWVITWVNPGDTNFVLLEVDDANLNGNSRIEETVRGHGVTQVDMVITQNQQGHFWQSAETEFDSQEAETAPATGGATVSDNLATNDVAKELDVDNEENTWNVGALDPGDYVFKFWVSDVTQNAEYEITVTDLPSTVLATRTITENRSVYTPAYELDVTLDGTEDIQMSVKKTDATANKVRVDKYEYEAIKPILHGGSIVTVSILITGSPTTPGTNLQATLWY